MTPNEPRDTVPADPPVVEPVAAPANPPAFLPAYFAELAEVLRRDLHAEHPLLIIAGSASGPQAVAVLVALGGTREVYTAEDGSRFVRAVVRFGDLEISAQHVVRPPAHTISVDDFVKDVATRGHIELDPCEAYGAVWVQA